jgi:hypothetical protein
MPTVQELEAEIAATRSRLQDTIGRIQDKLTVSGMVDEVIGQAGIPRMESGTGLAMTLLKRHPVPVMVAAAGIGWLIWRMNQGAAAGRQIDYLERDEALADIPAALNTGQARLYDPDTSARHPLAEGAGETKRVEA